MAIFPLGGSPLPSIHETTSTQTAPLPDTPVKNAWDDYTNHIKKWFFNPDLEAVQVTLAAAASHFHKDCDPLWLFILGPSGGDKTSLCINSLLELSQVHMQGELTAKTFLSGYTGTAHPS